MKIKRSHSSFETRRRGINLPIIPILLAALLVVALVVLWSRGGEKPQVRVEKTISAERLGK
jgi:sensor domain CHASE-containing protein